MTLPFGTIRLRITVSRAIVSIHRWEDRSSIGMDDRDLARLNQVNRRDPVNAPWAGARLCYDPPEQGR
jgi:hypothetical protein